MTTTDLLSKIDTEIQKADKALTAVPKDEQLKLREAFARLKEWHITKEKCLKIINEK
jgi:hypothetical protein